MQCRHLVAELSALHFRKTSDSSTALDMRARRAVIIRPLCEKTLLTGAELAGMQTIKQGLQHWKVAIEFCQFRWRVVESVGASAVLLRLVAGSEAASVVLLSQGRGQKLEAEALTFLRQWDFAAFASLYGCVTTSAAKLLEDQKPEARIHGCMTLTVKKFWSWLLLKVLMLNIHEIWSFDSQKNY